MLNKEYLVKINFEIQVEAKNEEEARAEFWNNVDGCQDDLETIIEQSLRIKEL